MRKRSLRCYAMCYIRLSCSTIFIPLERAVDLLLALIELSSLDVTAEALRAKIDWKSAFSLQRGQFDSKFQVGVALHQPSVGYHVAGVQRATRLRSRPVAVSVELFIIVASADLTAHSYADDMQLPHSRGVRSTTFHLLRGMN